MTHAALAFLVRLATGVRLQAETPRDGDRPRIYFANHSSHLDFMVIWAALPADSRKRARPVAALEYWEGGPLRRWLAKRLFRAVLITRDPAHMKSDDPMGKMLAALDEGADLIVFPEGTRSGSGEVTNFKPGLYHLVTKRPGLELIPVFLENLSRILPKGELFPLPLMGQARFGGALDPPGESETKAAFLVRARAAVMDLSHGNLSATNDE